MKLLTRLLPQDLRDGICGDIQEEYATGSHSRFWLWRQILLAVIHSVRFERRRIPGTKGGAVMPPFIQDIQYAFRLMLKKPGFTFITVFMLALGVALNVSIFSVVNAVLIRPLAYQNPERIFKVWQDNTRDGTAKDAVSPANFNDWRERSSTFERLVAVRPWEIELQQDRGAQLVKSSLVSEDTLK
jgi:hypothetical protein